MTQTVCRMKRIVDMVLVLFVGVILGGGILLLSEIYGYAADRKTYGTIQQQAVATPSSDSTHRSIDFEYLLEVNPGTCSWITIPDTNIDYPIVQGEDNKFYLKHDMNGDDSHAGAIFLDCECSADMTDIKTIIYGHNMKDGSMFHDLHNFRKDASFGKSHPYMYLYMENDFMMQYELLCSLSTSYNDMDIYGYVEDGQSAYEVASAIVSHADTVYADVRGTPIVVLSTCIKGAKRFDVIYQQLPGMLESVTDQ